MVSLVTGATGFVGHHLVEHLLALGEPVHVLHRASSQRPIIQAFEAAGVTVHRYSSNDEVQSIAASITPDTVYHLATHYLKDHKPSDVSTLIDANVSFGAHLLEGVVGSDATVVSAMSFFQFRANSPTPFSLYSATKQAFLDIADYYRTGRAVDVRQVVLYDTYGPHDTRDKLIPRLIEVATTGEHVSLGSPLQPLNLLYASDVASGLVAAAGEGAPAMMALRAPRTYTVAEIAATIGAVAGSELSVAFNHQGVVNDLVTQAGDWPTPHGWAAAVDLESGVRSILAS